MLFTSDVSARGVDYPDVSLVLQVCPPTGSSASGATACPTFRFRSSAGAGANSGSKAGARADARWVLLSAAVLSGCGTRKLSWCLHSGRC